MIKEKILFLKKLSTLLEIDMSIREALPLAYKYCKNKKLRTSLAYVEEQLRQGETLASALQVFPDIWDQITTSIIWSGEVSGELSRHIKDAALILEKRNSFAQRIIGTMVYPIAISLLSICLIFFLLFYIYPKIIPVLQSLRIPMPLATRIVLFVKSSLESYWYIGIAFVGCIYVLILFRKKNKRLERLFEKIVLQTPFIGKIIYGYQLAIVAKNIGTISNSQLGLIKSFDISHDLTSFSHIKSFLREMKETVQQGKILSEYAKESKNIPDEWGDLLLIGERSSTLSLMFVKISEMHEEDVEQKVLLYSKSLEPILMIMTGLIVLFIALSIITPMYSVTQYVQ